MWQGLEGGADTPRMAFGWNPLFEMIFDIAVGMGIDDNGNDNGNFRGEGGGYPQFSTQVGFSPWVIC